MQNGRKLVVLSAVAALGFAGTASAEAKANPALAMSQGLTMLPPEAKPGECYTRVYVPPKYENRTERVLVKDAYEKIEVTPAVYGSVTERVLVKEAGEKLEILDENGRPIPEEQKPLVRTRADGTIEIIPMAFETVTQRVLVKQASDRLVVVPPVYETVTQRVLVKPAQTTWKPAKGRIYGPAMARNAAGQPITRINNSTGEIMCLVQEPAQYRTIKKTVLRKAAATRRAKIAAEYKTVTKRIPKKVTVRRVPTAPEYKTITKRVVKTGANERRVKIPAEFETVQKRVLVSKGAVQWMEVLCEVNVTQDNIRQIQSRLRKLGFYNGALDGVIGRGTMDSISNFQKSRGLVRAGITRETIKALGLSLN